MVFVAALVVYWITLCPTVWVGDCGELIAAAHTLGIPHPTGYPLWLLLTKLFTLVVPFGTAAWRANLFSAVCAALASEVLARALRRLGASRLAAFGGGLTLAFLGPIWSEATVALTYSLAAACSAAMLWCVARWIVATSSDDATATAPRAADRWLVLHNLALGFGLANHLMVMAHAPALLAVVAGRRRSDLKRPGLWSAAILALAPGLSLYAYLPLRARAQPPLDYRIPLDPNGDFVDPSSPQARWTLFDLAGRPKDASFTPLDAWKVDLSYLRRDAFQGRRWAKSFADGVTIVAHHAKGLARELSPFWIPIGVCFCVFGAFDAWRTRRRSLVVAAILLWFGNLTPLALHGAWWDVFLYPRYMSTGFVATTLLVGLGIAASVRHVRSRWRGGTATSTAAVAALATPALLLVANWRTCDRRDGWLLEDYARALYAELPPNAQFLSGSDVALYPMFTLRHTQDVRPDVDLVNESQGLAESELLKARIAQRHGAPPPPNPRAAYTVDHESDFLGLERRRVGLLFELELPGPKRAATSPDVRDSYTPPTIRGLDRDDEPDAFARSAIASIESDLADAAAVRGDREQCRRRLERVARLAAPRPWGARYGVATLTKLASDETRRRQFTLAREELSLARRLVTSALAAGDARDPELRAEGERLDGDDGLVDAQEFATSDLEKHLDGLRRAAEPFESYAVVYVQELVGHERFDVARRALDHLRTVHRASRGLEELDARLRAQGR